MSFSISEGIQLSTGLLSYKSAAADLQHELAQMFVLVAVGTATKGSNILPVQNSDYRNGKYIYVDDEIYISQDDCTTNTGIIYTVVNVSPDIYLQHNVDISGQVNICKRIFPGVVVSLSESQQHICSSSGIPDPVVITFSPSSTIFLDAYPLLTLTSNTLTGTGGRYQTFHCTATAGAFKVVFRDISGVSYACQ